MAFMWLNVKFAKNSMSDKLKTPFRPDGTRTALYGKNFDLSNNNDKSALLRHYANYHTQNFNTKLTISDCFSVIFVEEPKLSHLDWCEDKWYNKLEAAKLR